MTDKEPMPTCPMAKTCKCMMGKPMPSFALIVAGLVLIILGVVVLYEPQILVWLVAIALIAMGVSILMLNKFLQKMGQQFRPTHG